MDENVLYKILAFVGEDYDYSTLFMNDTLKEKIRLQYLTRDRKIVNDWIINHFGEIFYWDECGPFKTKLEVNHILSLIYNVNPDKIKNNYMDLSMIFHTFKNIMDENIPRKRKHYCGTTRNVYALLL